MNAGMVMPQPDFDSRMLEFLNEIYKLESTIRTEDDIYNLFANTRKVDASFEDLLTLLEALAASERWYRGLGGELTLKLQQTKRSFKEALQDVLAVKENTATVQEMSYAKSYLSQFFHVQFPRHASCEVKARVAMNIGEPYVEKAVRVARALVPCGFKLHSFKVAGPASAGRTDQIVAYLCSTEDLAAIKMCLENGNISDCFGTSVPPAMQTVMPGIGFAEEPPNVPKSYVTTSDGTIRNPSKYDPSCNSYNGAPKNNQRMSFAEFHSNRVWAGLVKWRSDSKKSCGSNEAVRYVSFMHEIYLAYGRKRVNLKEPYKFPARESTEAKWRKKYAEKNI
jgi:hypothetical protein